MPKRVLPDDWVDITREFGERVRRLRKMRGLTQEQLAHRAGVSRNQVQNIENSRNNVRSADGTPQPGPGNPSLDTIWAFALALEVDAADLVRREPKPTDRPDGPHAPRSGADEARD